MPSTLATELSNIFKSLSEIDKLNFIKDNEVKIGNPRGESLKISPNGIESPVNNSSAILTSKVSPLPNQTVDQDLLRALVGELSKHNSIRGLNHVGFCYHVESQIDEKKRLLDQKLTTDVRLYEEPSNDNAKWYFIGNTDNPEEPMLELLPVESNGDTFIDYWLPHVHIDIDTILDENQIESLLYKVYDGEPKPFRPTVIDNVVYSIRTRLGVVDGVNLFLDLSTKHRRVEFSRKNTLAQLK